MKKGLSRSLMVVTGAALLAGAAVLPARADDKVDFDQGVDVSAAVSSLRAQNTGEPQGPGKTYSTGEARVHAKGFHSHKGRHRDHKKAGELGGAHQSVVVPDTLDLRPSLTQIEDQGQCGDCWAFSLTATNRDGHAIDGKDPGRLSQEWLADNSPESDGCNGGDFDSAQDLVNGQPAWSSCPYTSGATGQVEDKCSSGLTPADNSQIKAWHMLGDENTGPSVLDIETEIATSGKPVSIAIAAAAGDWENYTGGVYNGCTQGQLDHMINIVGWDNQGAKFDANGNLPPGKGVWILRNSWGTSWGEKGYMRTQMTDAQGNRCNGVAEQAAYFDFADSASSSQASR